MSYRIWLFGKEHPEIFESDTTVENKQVRREKAEFRRQYNNKSMLSISVIFLWIIGVTVICTYFTPTNQGLFMLAFAAFAIFFVFSFIQRKPKK